MKEELLKNLSGKDAKDALNNILTAQIIDDYLEYCRKVVKVAIGGSDNYNAQKLFAEIGDDLIITPDELVELIDKVQIALEEVN